MQRTKPMWPYLKKALPGKGKGSPLSKGRVVRLPQPGFKVTSRLPSDSEM